MVSCVMPSLRGRAVARVAVESFLAQTWEEKELVILDNSDDGSAAAFATLPGVRVLRAPRRSIGELRNMGAAAARGEVILNWDDDDWYAPKRILRQVHRLMATGAEVTGWHSVLYFVPGVEGECFRFQPSSRLPRAPYAMGTSQCYWREWWRAHPYPRTSSGEDAVFGDAALRVRKLDSCDAGDTAVVRQLEPDEPLRSLLGRHEQWPAARREDFPPEFFEQVLDEQRAAIAAKEP